MPANEIAALRPPVPRTYLVTYTNDSEATFEGITRTELAPGVLTLYRRERPGDAEVHVASLPLVNVRKWTKTVAGELDRKADEE